MSGNSRYPLLNSFGVEIETEGILRGNLPSNLRNSFSEDHDASIETPGIRINPENHSQFFEDPEGLVSSFPKATIGSELVSRVLNVENTDDKQSIFKLCGWLCENGESHESFRAGIHVHISMGYDQKILMNLVKVTAHLEQVFYYLGGMGYEFRGLQNDFTYCRPITKFGPSVIKGSKYFQAFTTNKLLATANERNFFDAYGGINIENPPGKYYPIRYNWFTFYPLLSKGTVEFRVFNKTLNPQYIWSAILLSRKVCEVSLKTNHLLDLAENSIYDDHSKDHVLRTFINFAEMYGLDDRTIRTIAMIIERTPEIKPEQTYVFTHLPADRFSMNYQYTEPYYIGTRIVKEPNFIDSHRLARETGGNEENVPRVARGSFVESLRRAEERMQAERLRIQSEFEPEPESEDEDDSNEDEIDDEDSNF